MTSAFDNYYVEYMLYETVTSKSCLVTTEGRGVFPLGLGLLLFIYVNRDQFGTGMFSEQISMMYTLTQNITHSHSEHVSRDQSGTDKCTQ